MGKLISMGLIVPLAALWTCGCAGTTPSSSSEAARQADVQPGAVGSRAPSVTILTPEGRRFDIGRAYRDQPSVLVFYRGGWCPYCNTHLMELAHAESELRELGFRILAVSPDRPESLRESIAEHGFGYQLLSDQDMLLARAFGIAFRVDDQTVKLYEGYGIDLRAASGRDHYELPVPAVYLIDRDGVIRFVHRDEDYRQRLSAEELLAAARRLSGRDQAAGS